MAIGTIPNAVRRMRRDRDWTQAQLAGMTGVSRKAIIAIEQGVTPGLLIAFRLRRAFCVETIAEIFPEHAAMADEIKDANP